MTSHPGQRHDPYRQAVLDHAANPHGQGLGATADIEVAIANPSCGDELTVQVDLADTGHITGIRHAGSGCAISRAAMSIVARDAHGMHLAEVTSITPEWVAERLADAQIPPMRTDCLMLGAHALTAALVPGNRSGFITRCDTVERVVALLNDARMSERNHDA